MRRKSGPIGYLIATIAIMAVVMISASAGEQIVIRPEEVVGRTGKYLTGVHFVYSSERDSIYEDGTFARWARRAGVSVARFPGGTVVKYWDWQDPTGFLKGDPWEDSSPKRAPPANWMSLDEYLHFVRVSGVAPLIGINMLSGVRNDRIDDSVSRAAEQVEYVVSKGHKGAFYYLGNEDMAHIGGLEATARLFVEHAAAIKQVDSAAKLFWNDDYVNEARLRRFLAIAGEYADGVEFHGKWSYGVQKNREAIRFGDWQRQYPFGMEKWGRFSERALALRHHATELGYPRLMFANNEYGLAPFEHERFAGFDRYKFGLVAIEFLQDLFIGQFDMAAFWSNVPERTRGSGKGGRRLIDTDAGNRLNPFHFGLEMLSPAQDKDLVRIHGGGPGGYGFAVLSQGRLEVFLLNKNSSRSSIDLRVKSEKYVVKDGRITSLVDTADHWGEQEKRVLRTGPRRFDVILPPLSYSRIELSVEQSAAVPR